MSHYIHTVPGRIRIKNQIFKYNPQKCETAKETLESLPDLEAYIISVDPNGDIQEFRTEGFDSLVVKD